MEKVGDRQAAYAHDKAIKALMVWASENLSTRLSVHPSIREKQEQDVYCNAYQSAFEDWSIQSHSNFEKRCF